MKLSSVKFFQSVKCGQEEFVFLKNTHHDLELKENLIYITDRKTSSIVITPLTNIPWFIPEGQSGQKKSSKSTRRTKATKATGTRLESR